MDFTWRCLTSVTLGSRHAQYCSEGGRENPMSNTANCRRVNLNSYQVSINASSYCCYVAIDAWITLGISTWPPNKYQFILYEFLHSWYICSFFLSNCCKIPNYGIYMLFIDYWWSQVFLYLPFGHWISMNYSCFLSCFVLIFFFSSVGSQELSTSMSFSQHVCYIFLALCFEIYSILVFFLLKEDQKLCYILAGE